MIYIYIYICIYIYNIYIYIHVGKYEHMPYDVCWSLIQIQKIGRTFPGVPPCYFLLDYSPKEGIVVDIIIQCIIIQNIIFISIDIIVT